MKKKYLRQRHRIFRKIQIGYQRKLIDSLTDRTEPGKIEVEPLYGILPNFQLRICGYYIGLVMLVERDSRQVVTQ